MTRKLIRFDWAMKKLLRHKANFGILEGFLSELLRFDILIESILESEGNKDDEYDKYNRVDILVKSQTGELMLVEVQNDSEVDYFQRMIFGVSKLVTEYIKQGEPYGTIKKIYSINIVYFGLGQGKDYIYDYKGEFIGRHEKDVLQPTILQKQNYKIEYIEDIFPKYYILKVNNFNDIAKDRLDEWIYFLKNSEVKDEFKAKGLDKAKEKLQYEALSYEERKSYDRSEENITIAKSVERTRELEAEQRMLEVKLEAEQKILEAEQKILETEQKKLEAEQKTLEAEQKTLEAEQKTLEAEQKKLEAEQKVLEAEYARSIEVAKKSILAGLQNELITQITGLTSEQIETLRNEK